jgi:hypothetical protein
VLGPLRELVLAPRIGGMPAALAEAVAMAGLLWLAARLATATVPPERATRAVVAGVALGLVVLVLEVALGVALEMSGLASARAPRSLAELAVGWALLAWLAVLPFLVRRHARALP